MLRNGPTRSFWSFASLRSGAIALALTLLPLAARSQTAISKHPAQQAVNIQGRTLFESSCAVCHGLDGGGGEHAPNIGRASAAKALTDSDLSRIPHDGVPGKGMPAFNTLGNIKINSILSDLRFLQGKSKSLADTGNLDHGKEVFFGQGQRAICHAIGNGHFLSTDLSDFTLDHRPNEIRAAIVSPQEREGVPHTMVGVTAKSGQHFSGLID